MQENPMSKRSSNEETETIQCLYMNRTEKIAILKIDFMGQRLERVVEAGKEFLFKAPEGAYLEICTYEMATMVLEDRVPCRELAIQGEDFFD
jgi:hypothetical protein